MQWKSLKVRTLEILGQEVWGLQMLVYIDMMM